MYIVDYRLANGCLINAGALESRHQNQFRFAGNNESGAILH